MDCWLLGKNRRIGVDDRPIVVKPRQRFQIKQRQNLGLFLASQRYFKTEDGI